PSAARSGGGPAARPGDVVAADGDERTAHYDGRPARNARTAA
ncbi:MAG: hypothetical protein JWN17_2656, partial [Frankiales bacterium]|nr:hypothetical protein [Frankiales bacterium]